MSEPETGPATQSLTNPHIALTIADELLKPLGEPLEVRSEPALEESEAEAAFDNYCRSAGALDFFDLFRIVNGDGVTLARSARDRYPDAFDDRMRDLFRDAPAKADKLLHKTGRWDVLQQFILGYSLAKVELVEGIFVPVFCAHPVENIQGSRVTVETSETATRDIAFDIHLPGVKGSIGCTQMLSFSGKVENSAYSYQWQVRLSALLRTWVSDTDEKVTVCLIPNVGTPETKETDASQPDYLDYDLSKKSREIRTHNQVLSQDSSRGLGLSIGGKDEFELSLPIRSTTTTLKITSTCNQEFKVLHTLPKGYCYTWYGLNTRRRGCHDIHVKAVKIK